MSKFKKLKGQKLAQQTLETIQGGNRSSLQCKHPFLEFCIPASYLGGSCPSSWRRCGY